jgi:DNA-binding response OmpR family regulator
MPRILVLEDDESLRLTLGDAFVIEGYAVTLCPGLASALQALENESVDVILTNFGRTPGDDIDTSRVTVLRQQAPLAKIVLFTGHAQANSLDLRELGIAAVLLKPADLEKLQAVIRDVLD